MYRPLAFLIPILALLFTACTEENSKPQDPTAAEVPKNEAHRAVLDLGDGHELPFNFVTQYVPGGGFEILYIYNADEEIMLDEVREEGDTLVIPFPIFESELRMHKDNWNGRFLNHARTTHRSIPLTVTKGEARRFIVPEAAPAADLSGRWEVEFLYKETEKSVAVGIFEQDGSSLTGTFQTPTGDYRYLAGSVNGSNMMLSCFDGAHAFLFTAEIQADGKLSGGFWSGRHWYESWTAQKNPGYELPDPNSLTKLKPGMSSLDFAFLNPAGETISPSDPAYEGKALLVQIMGTWCPNCKDETAYLRELHKRHQAEGLEVIAIGFELTTDTSRALANLQRLQKHFELPYQVVFGGRAGRETAGAALPALEHVMSYPTTVFMDRDHKVRRIYTGFSGPAVEGAYEKLTESFEKTVREMLQTGV